MPHFTFGPGIVILLVIFAFIIAVWIFRLKHPSTEGDYWFDTFFDVPISDFLTICISLIALIAGVVIFSAEVNERRVDRASAAVLQIETFLHNKYPIQKNIKKLKEEEVKKIHYYGSTAELKESLEILHENERQFTFLYLPRSELGFIKLTKAKLWYANFSGAFLEKSNFNGADLYKANLSETRLYKANISKADLYGAEFNGANMKEANLTGAVITATDFTDARNLTKKQIMETCWLRPAIYKVNGKEKLIFPDFPILPENIGIEIYSLSHAKLADKRGEIAYCP